MARSDVILPAEPVSTLPRVRSIGPMDLKEALEKGFEDFRAMPTHVVFLSFIYPVIGLTIGRAVIGYDVVPLLYPLAAGFALVGPFAGIGLYELSRRREQGLDTSWRHAFDVVHSPSFGPIMALGLLLLALFGVWIAVAHAIYIATFGERQTDDLLGFITRVLTTPEGHSLIVIGNAVGFLFAVAAFTISVVSFPLLLDRNVGLAAAIATSMRAVVRNPATMTLWGLIIAGGLVLGSLPFFLGLAVVMPILGHSTWHLYRRVVEADATHRPEFHPRPRGRRYAADFPSSLFFPSTRGEDERP